MGTIDLLDSVDINPNGGAFEACFLGPDYLSTSRFVQSISHALEGRAPQTFPKWPSDHSSHQQEVGDLRTAKKKRGHRAVANAKQMSKTEA